MPAPIPVEMRQRIVDSWKSGEGSFRVLAKRFKVGEASVNRWVSLERRTGSLKPKPMGGSVRKDVLGQDGTIFVLETLRSQPDTTLVELATLCRDELQLAVTPQRLSIEVKRLGLTRKRGSFVQQLPIDRS